MNDQDEIDRYRYLQLKAKMASSQLQSPLNQSQPDQPLPVGQIASDATRAAVMGPYDATKKFFQTDPATMQRVGGPVLPIIGGIAGGPVGAATGEMLRQMAGTALAPDTVPQTGLGRFGSVMGAGIAQDPSILKAIPGVPVATDLANRTGKMVGNGAARIGEALSGVKAQDIKQLFRNPSQLFSLGSREAAGEAIGKAKTLAGVNPGITDAPISFTPENVTKALHEDSLGEKAIQNVAQANLSGADPSVEEVGDGLKFISKKIKKGLASGEDTSELQAIQKHLNNTLDRIAPNVQQARQDFAPLAQRDKFLKLFPTNKNGTISKANLLYLNTIAKGITAPIRAPIITGLITSAAGGAAQAINKIGSNPQARQVLASVLQRLLANKAQQ